MGYTLGLVASSDGFSLCFFLKCDVETKSQHGAILSETTKKNYIYNIIIYIISIAIDHRTISHHPSKLDDNPN